MYSWQDFSQSPLHKVLHEKFHGGRGYSFLGKVLPKGPKTSMRNSSSVGSILDKILPKVPKSFMRSSSSWERVFLTRFYLKSLSPPWEVPFLGEGGILCREYPFCVILTTLLSHWARLCIVDSLSRVETNYQLELKSSLLVASPSFYLCYNINSRLLPLAVTFLLRHYIERQCHPSQHTINAFLDRQLTQIFTRIH